MKLRLAHGREDSYAEMDDWGFDGPTLMDVNSFQQMYAETYTVGFTTIAAKDAAQHTTGWPTWSNKVLEAPNFNGLVETHEPGKPTRYYADLVLCETSPVVELAETTNRAIHALNMLREQLEEFDALDHRAQLTRRRG